MSILPEVKCRRCGQTFSALRTSCPNCGTRRVSQSGRTPAPTPSTVKGTAAAERADTNTRWQMIFGLILVVAVILAVIVMVSTSLNGLDNGVPSAAGRTKTTPTPEPTPEMSVIEAPPTPAPTPTPKPDSVKVFFFEKDYTDKDFTIKNGWEPVKLTAQAYPVGNFPDATFKWTISDDSVIKITVSEDTKECTCEFVSHRPGGVTLTCSCNGVEAKVTIYTGN